MIHPQGRALFPASFVARCLWYTYHRAARALLAGKSVPVKYVSINESWY
jgi:hypothetical protein